MNVIEIIASLQDNIIETNENKYILNDLLESALISYDFSIDGLDKLYAALKAVNVEVVDELPNNNIAGYELLFEGRKRYYIEDLTQRNYNYECTTPYKLEFCDKTIQESAWTEMIRVLASTLLEMFPKKEEELFEFRVFWSKHIIFSPSKRTNFKPITPNLFVNCNHTALHSCWFIQELLTFFDVDKANTKLYIHRPSSAEPKEVKEFILLKSIKNFKIYLQEQYDKSEEICERIIGNINNQINKLLKNVSKSYDNVFLFDDYLTMYSYCDKIKGIIKKSLKYSDKQKRILERYIFYLLEFNKKYYLVE